MKSITLISQDFYPLHGGIANYLMRIYQNYFFNQQFQAIIPRSIGKYSDYNSLPFKTYRLELDPFNFSSERRQKTNQEILDILHFTNTDITLFGYIRSHSEIGLIYKKQNLHSKWGIFMHGKEAFIDNAIVNENSFSTGSHKGYTKEEALFYKNILQNANYVFCVSQFTKDLLLSQGIQREYIVLYPNIPFIPEENNFNRNNLFRLLSVGRLIKRKGHEKVLKTIPLLLDKIPTLRYNIIGDGPEKENLLKIITNLHLEEQVNLQTNISDLTLQRIYNSSDIFVLPTDFIPPNDIEGFGIVFLEANMCGLPVIGGNTGGVTEAIIDGETGYLIDSKDSVELEERILDLYNNSAKRYLMGKAGRKRVLNQFSETRKNEIKKILSG